MPRAKAATKDRLSPAQHRALVLLKQNPGKDPKTALTEAGEDGRGVAKTIPFLKKRHLLTKDGVTSNGISALSWPISGYKNKNRKSRIGASPGKKGAGKKSKAIKNLPALIPTITRRELLSQAMILENRKGAFQEALNELEMEISAIMRRIGNTPE